MAQSPDLTHFKICSHKGVNLTYHLLLRLHFAQVHLKYINVLFKHFSCSVLKFKVRKNF